MAIKLMPGEYSRQGGEKSSFLGIESVLGVLEPKKDLLFVVAMVLLVLAVSASLGLWWYSNDLTVKKDLVTAQIDKLQSQRDLDLEKKLTDLDRSIKKMEEILKNRVYPDNVLKLLESLALPEVSFSNFNADLNAAKISIDVKAPNYNKLAEQMVVFEKDSRVKKVDFSNIQLNEDGGATSHFQLDFDPALLKSE